jgi:hypothetical protein
MYIAPFASCLAQLNGRTPFLAVGQRFLSSTVLYNNAAGNPGEI